MLEIQSLSEGKCNQKQIKFGGGCDRLIGLDILKVFAIFMIVLFHISRHGGFYDNTSGVMKIFLNFVYAMFWPSVNIFVYVSFYLIIKKNKVTLKNFIKLFFQIIFYNLIMCVILYLFKSDNFSLKLIMKSFLPVLYSYNWFAGIYLIAYMLAPLLLKIINNLNFKEYSIVVAIILACVLGKTFIGIDFLEISDGFNYIWFIILFFIVGYQVKFSYVISKKNCLIIYFLALLLSFIYMLKTKAQNVCEYTNILCLFQTISLFNLLYDIKIKNKFINKLILLLATSTFGIYLFHDNDLSKPIIYYKIIKTQNYFASPNVLLYYFLTAVVIILVGLIIETIRKFLFKRFETLIKFIEIKSNKTLKNEQ